jgi:hypothetical protein
MKYIPIYLSIFLIFLTSCSEEVNLNGDFKETAVVYGLLDHADSIHFIKITRAFIGPGNSLEIAQIPDSSYFNNVELTVSEYQGGALLRTWLLEDTIVTNKDVDGAFYAPEQKVYYFKTLPTVSASMGVPGTVQTSPNPLLTSLKPGCTYKMKAIINDGAFEVNGETELVNGLNLSQINNNQFSGFSFFNSFQYKYISDEVRLSSTGNSSIISCDLRVEFEEYIANIGELKTFKWFLGEKPCLKNQVEQFSIEGELFYQLIASNVTQNNQIDKRKMKGILITVTGGAQELYNYMVVNKPTTSLAQSKPTYTNLSITEGKRVVGIFSSRQTLELYLDFKKEASNTRCLDQKSTRQLCIGDITGLLNFCSNHPMDQSANPSFPYCP